MLDIVKGKYHKWFKQSYTVVCDKSPFFRIVGQQEYLFRVNGLFNAKRIAKKWITENLHGQARIIRNHD